MRYTIPKHQVMIHLPIEELYKPRRKELTTSGWSSDQRKETSLNVACNSLPPINLRTSQE